MTDDNGTQTEAPYPVEMSAMMDQVYTQPPPLPNHYPNRPPNHYDHYQHPHPHQYPHPHQHRPPQYGPPQYGPPPHGPPRQHEAHRRNSNPGMRDPNYRNSHHRDHPYPREHGPHGPHGSGQRDPSHHNSGHPDSARRESGHHDPGWHEHGHQEPGRRNSGHHDPSQHHNGPRDPSHHSTGPREHRHRDHHGQDPRRRNSGHGSLDSPHPHNHHHRGEPHHRNSQEGPHGSNASLTRQNTAPPNMDGPQRSGSGRKRLPAMSTTPDIDKTRRSSGGNIAVVSAVVESDPEQHSVRNPVLNSAPDPPLKSSEADFLLQQKIEDVTSAPQVGLPLDLDQQSDYDNQASDMEVNLESEADVHALDASGDEVEGHGQGLSSGQADSESSASSESDSTSSIDEERALFQQLTQNPRVNSRTNSRTNSLTQLPNIEDPLSDPLSGSGWDQFGAPPTFAQLGTKYPFTPGRPNQPCATDNDIIANNYFLDNHSSKRKKNDDGQIREFPYDPDPDATVV